MTVPTPTGREASKPGDGGSPPHRGLLLRRCACGGTPGPAGVCAECRRKRVQRSAAEQSGPGAVPPMVQEVLRSPGQPLDSATRAFFEPRFGHDFGRVRIHTDAKAAESARAVNAVAYTVGRDLVFDWQRYAPGTTVGDRLLAHELTHVVQQDLAGAALVSPSCLSQPFDSHEKEADRVAAAVFRNPANHAAHDKPTAMPLIPTIHRAMTGVLAREACQETGRLTSPEHQLIQSDYQIYINPNSAREYAIPESAKDGFTQGYADLVDLTTHAIYDIKNPTDVLTDSQEQVLRYITKAHEYCDTTLWHAGVVYPSPRIIRSFEPDTEMIVVLIAPGILEYRKRRRQRQPEIDPRLVLLLLAIVAAATAVAKKAPEQGVKGGPITAVIQLLAAAAVIVLAERQAKAGDTKTDDDPLVALAQMLDETGTPMPPEIRKLIEENPTLRQLLRIEVQRRRRSGARTSPDAKPGATGGSGATTTPSTTGGRADEESGAGTNGGGVDGIREEIEPKPAPPGRKAAAPAPDRSKQEAEGSIGANESYWQSAQKAMDKFNWDSLTGDNARQAVIDYPVDPATLKPEQELTLFGFGRDGQTRYVFRLTIELVARSSSNTIFRVKQSYGLLTSSGEQKPAPANYKAGTIFTATDHK